jgi:pectin methylesterase-like acyl-CoA thioesterase
MFIQPLKAIYNRILGYIYVNQLKIIVSYFYLQNCSIAYSGEYIEPGVLGYITAQGRLGPYDSNGFVFKGCSVHGSGSTYLGRPWRAYSRVIFYNSNFSHVVHPTGWDAWNYVSSE